ncbi:peptidase inhibitor family I36 protein [Streptomyces sp. GbtcB6]|uniref:peptidase inhibitor family I36 protein n=1 Tax=Streptomyces sp. GbtcB6 TaxID=2824751 RepID=UPI001C3008EA|nr:peptidase inhibitor family I36 protein [Streptomyces sp. GbtcB6]
MSLYEQEHDRKSSRTPRRGRRALVAAALTFATAALGLIAPSAASASTQAAWDCPSGDLCVWTGIGGTGSRCTWSNADADWYYAPTVCSWADDQVVGSAKNSGTSSSYNWVILYTDANYTGVCYAIAQHGGTLPNLNHWFRSHRWSASGSC